jgi:hypothetical protein
MFAPSDLADSANWLQKYKSIKRKYRDLHKVRVASVSQDLETMRLRISEHQRFRDEKVTEIKEHTETMRRTIESTKAMKSEIQRLQASVDAARRSLKARDPVLNILLEYPCFQVSVLEASTYQVACGREKLLQFGLVKDDDIHYYPIAVPRHITLPRELGSEFQMRLTDLRAICRNLSENTGLNPLK